MKTLGFRAIGVLSQERDPASSLLVALALTLGADELHAPIQPGFFSAGNTLLRPCPVACAVSPSRPRAMS
jgi:hypothetical protein